MTERLYCRTCGATPAERGDAVSAGAVAYTCSGCWAPSDAPLVLPYPKDLLRLRAFRHGRLSLAEYRRAPKRRTRRKAGGAA
jgi:hypothetical protein